MFLSVSLIDDIHRMVNLRSKEDGILGHGRHMTSSEAIDDFLGCVRIEA